MEVNKVISEKENTSGQESVSVAKVSQDQAIVKDIDNWLSTREVFLAKVSSKMKEGKDFHILKFNGRESKSLAKGGAEKIASIWKWTAKFRKDEDTWEMLGKLNGVICYVCELFDQTGTIIGQGRGARDIKKDGGDVNKAIKMAQKSAHVDAVIRTSGLSDIFTQDLEDMSASDYETSDIATAKQVEFIKTLMAQKGIAKLTDIGITQPKVITKDFASDVISELQTYTPKSAIEQETTEAQEELRRIGDSI